MSFLGTITAALKLVPGVTTAIEAVGGAIQRAARPKPPPIPFGRRHMWDPYVPGKQLERRPTPVCVYCETEQTTDNEDALCPGPKKPATVTRLR